jgi:hypothetical protein
MATKRSAAGRRSAGASLLARRIGDLGITYDEAARQIRGHGAETVGRASVCHWLNGQHAPSRRNAQALAAWSGGTIPTPSWDEPSAKGGDVRAGS